MGLTMKNFYIIGVYWKIIFLRGFHEKPLYIRENCLKRGAWRVCRFKGGLAKKREGGVFEIGGGGQNKKHRIWPKLFEFVEIWYLKVFLVLTVTETSIATTSYSFNFFFWSNYSLHFASVKIHCLYQKVVGTNIYRKIFFQQFATFLAIFVGQ